MEMCKHSAAFSSRSQSSDYWKTVCRLWWDSFYMYSWHLKPSTGEFSTPESITEWTANSKGTGLVVIAGGEAITHRWPAPTYVQGSSIEVVIRMFKDDT